MGDIDDIGGSRGIIKERVDLIAQDPGQMVAVTKSGICKDLQVPVFSTMMSPLAGFLFAVVHDPDDCIFPADPEDRRGRSGRLS